MWWTRRRSEMPPLMAEAGPFAAWDALPVAALFMDARGEVVHRNQEAIALAKRVSSERGDILITELRTAVRQIAQHENRFPAHRVVELQNGSAHVAAVVIVNRISKVAFVATWRDITGERDKVRASESAASDLSSTATSFTSLGAQMLEDTGQVSTQASTVAAASEQMSASIREISDSASAAVSATSSAVKAAEQASERLGKLAESSSRIGAVSNLITGIAEQTNLLALNATIEAARAGEAGKGFAVVAGEVKDLASRTAKATGEIGEMIGVIQQDSADAEASIAEITRVIGEIQHQQTMVAGAVDQQTATAQEISASMTAVADAAASATSAAGQLREQAADVARTSEELRALFA